MAWLEGWTKRIPITVYDTYIDSELTNFPLYVRITDVDFFTALGSNKYKIAFAPEDASEEYYIEVELWDNSGNEACLYVRIPTISFSGNSSFYLYFDPLHADNTTYVGIQDEAAAQTVWTGNDAWHIWHMNDLATTTDSTSQGYDLSQVGTPVIVSGRHGFGKCLDFPGTAGNRIEKTSNDSHGSGNKWTVSAWVESDGWLYGTNANDYVILSDIYGGGNGVVTLQLNHTGTRFRVQRYSPWEYSEDTSNFTTTSQWVYVAGVLDSGNELRLYRDALQKDTSPCATSSDNSQWRIGCRHDSEGDNGSYWNGRIDEVRLYKADKGTDWLKAEYYSTLNDAGFINYGTIESLFVGYFDGTVEEEGIAAVRAVRAHRRDTGEMMFETTSSGGGGYFYGETSYSGSHYVVCLDDGAGESYNLLAYDLVVPTTASG